MDSKSTVSAGALPISASIWRWIFVVLGLLFVIVPTVQIYIILQPTLEMLAFMPLSFYLKEMAGTILLMNATLLSTIAFLVGGMLLCFGKRWGYILTLSASGFALLAMIEVVVSLFVVDLKNDSSYLEIAYSEISGLMGFWIVLLVLMEISSIILLNFSISRKLLSIRKREIWITVVMGILLLLDLNLCLLLQFPIGA